MRRFRPNYGSLDLSVSLGAALALLRTASQPRKPRVLTAEQLERRAKEDERAAWNRRIEERKAAKRAVKESA